MLKYYKNMFMMGIKSEFSWVNVETSPNENINNKNRLNKEVEKNFQALIDNNESNNKGWIKSKLVAWNKLEKLQILEYPVYIKRNWWNLIDIQIKDDWFWNTFIQSVPINQAKEAVNWYYKNKNKIDTYWQDRKVIYFQAKKKLNNLEKEVLSLSWNKKSEIINNKNIILTQIASVKYLNRNFSIPKLKWFDFNALQTIITQIQREQNPDTKFITNKEKLFKEIETLLALYNNRRDKKQKSQELEKFNQFFIQIKATDLKTKNEIYLRKNLVELVAELQIINKDIDLWKDRKEDKRFLIDYIKRRFKKEWLIVYFDNTKNKFKIKDSKTWKEITDLNISQSDLQAIAILSSETQEDDNKWNFEKNISDNMIQSVIDHFNLENPETKKPWGPNDFRWDTPATQAEASKNKKVFLKQIEDKINVLEAKNKNTNIQWIAEQFEGNTIWLQKLYLTKSYVIDEARVSKKALEFVQDFNQKREEAYSQINNVIKNWELKHLIMSKIPAVIFAWILAWIASKILPEKWMKNWAYAAIFATLWLDITQDYLNSWLSNKIWSGFFEKNPAWHNTPRKKHTWPIDMMFLKNNIKEALTLEPKWLRPDHKLKYAKMITVNKEKNLFEREKFDKMFMLLSNDPTFLSKQKSEISQDKLKESNIKDFISKDTYKKLTTTYKLSSIDIWKFIELLRDTDPETRDATVSDLFIDNRWEEAWFKKEVKKYIPWQTKFNKEIFNLINQLPWLPFNSEYLLQWESSLKAQAQEAIWLSNSISTYWIPFVASKSTPKNIQKTIEALEKINNNNTITKIIKKYKEIKEVVEGIEKRKKFIIKVTTDAQLWIVWVWQQAVNKWTELLNNTITYLTWDPTLKPLEETENVKVKTIEQYITEWKKILGVIEKDKVTSLQEKLQETQNIKAIIDQLRQRKIEILEKIWWIDKEKEIQAVIVNQINDNPNEFIEKVNKSLNEMTSLTNPFDSYDEYIRALVQNADNIKSLSLIAGIDSTSLSDNWAKQALEQVKTIIALTKSGESKFKENLEKIIKKDEAELDEIAVGNIKSLQQLKEARDKLTTIKDKVFVKSLAWDVQALLEKFGITSWWYSSPEQCRLIILQNLCTQLFGQDYNITNNLSIDITTKETELTQKETELIKSLSDTIPNYSNNEKNFITGIKTFQEKNLKYLDKNIETYKTLKQGIDKEIKKLENDYIKKLNTAKLAQIWSIYDSWIKIAKDLDYDPKGFKEAYKQKLEEIAEVELEKKMNEKVKDTPEILKIYEEFRQTDEGNTYVNVEKNDTIRDLLTLLKDNLLSWGDHTKLKKCIRNIKTILSWRWFIKKSLDKLWYWEDIVKSKIKSILNI